MISKNLLKFNKNEKIYTFTNGNIFSFNDTVEKFLQKLYEGIDEEKPLGKERISIIDLEKSDYDLKTIFEMMSVSPERKIIVKDKTDLGLSPYPQYLNQS